MNDKPAKYELSARVAGSRSSGIDGVDGVPFSHTPPAALTDRKITDHTSKSAPRPFAASSRSGPIIVGLMLTTVGLMVARSLTSVAQSSPDGVGLVIFATVALVVWSVVLTIPAAVAALARRRSSDREVIG